jgi:opacity protein-like surface antigen
VVNQSFLGEDWAGLMVSNVQHEPIKFLLYAKSFVKLRNESSRMGSRSSIDSVLARPRSNRFVSLHALIAGMAAFLDPLGEALAQPQSQPAAAPATVDWLQALDPKGLYASFGAGAGWPQPVHYSDDHLGPRLPIRGEVLADPGFASERGLGYDFGRLRGELSWVRRQATIDDAASSWSVGPFRPIVSRDSPKVRSNSGFANLYLDLPVPGTRLIPYLGGGLGVTALQTSPTTLQLRRFRSTFGGSGKLPAYQAKVGLAYRSSPRMDLFAEAVFQGSPARSQGSLERSPLINWGLRLGLRWRFGRRVQPANPVAAPLATP